MTGTTKGRTALTVAVPAGLLVLLSTRPWAVGTSGDALASQGVEVTGGSAAPGAVGLAVVCVVAVLGLLTGGRVIRTAASVVQVLAALGALVLVVLVAARPRDAVVSQLTGELGRTTAPSASGSATAWAWLAVATAAALVVATVLAALASRRWGGLSSRYERSTGVESGPRGEVRSTWDDLTEGHDPTLDDEPRQT